MARRSPKHRLKLEREIESLVTEYKSEGLSERRRMQIDHDLFERFHKVALKIASQYRRNPISVEDMALSGMPEYRRALEKYDPAARGPTTFLNYAAHGIKFGILNEIRRHFGITTSWQVHFFSKESGYRREARSQHPDLQEGDIDVLVATQFLSAIREKGQLVSMKSVDEALERLHQYKALITAGYMKEYTFSGCFSGTSDVVSIVERTPDEDSVPVEVAIDRMQEAPLIRGMLAKAFEKMDDRQKYVFFERRQVFLEDTECDRSLDDLSKELGVSRERARQIFVQAYTIVKNEVVTSMREAGLTEIANMSLSRMELLATAGTQKSLDRHNTAKPELIPDCEMV